MMRTNVDLLLERFDPIKWMEDNNIEYYDSGKNISHGWVGLCCPFCGDDPSHHLGINLSNNLISCFRCQRGNGTVIKLVMKLHKVPFPKALKIMQQYVSGAVTEIPKQRSIQKVKEVSLSQFSEKLSPLARKYLKARNFDPDFIRRKYGILDGGVVGKYAHRIIIPFIQNRKVITYTTRDYSGKSILRYEEMPLDDCAIPSSHTLYNIDTIKDVAIVVEGPTDVWRIGDGCCAVTSIKYTNHQVKCLLRKNPKKIFVMFDHGAEEQARNFAYDVGTLFKGEIKILHLKNGDPANLPEDKVKQIRVAIFGKLF